MLVLKYFYEEPAALEALSSDDATDARRRDAPLGSLEDLLGGPRYYRGYLAGTDLANDRVGLTTLPAEAYVPACVAACPAPAWTQADASGVLATGGPDLARATFARPTPGLVLANDPAPVHPEALATVASAERRYGVPALRDLLDHGAIVWFAEPAHDGYDWSVFAARPLRETLTQALHAYPTADARRFALPFQRARSEHKFYFERWQLDDLPEWIEEIGG